MAYVHMIFGPVGAGKTTYAVRLSKEMRAVFFSLDEWMATLFMKDAQKPLSLDWALERTSRCESQIWKVCQRLLALDQDVVIELGFFRREQRDRFRELAGDAVKLHYVTASVGERRRRVRTRNQGSETLTVHVDDPMFDWAESWFEPPTEDELAHAIIVETDRG
jgi:predicted kinase